MKISKRIVRITSLVLLLGVGVITSLTYQKPQPQKAVAATTIASCQKTFTDYSSLDANTQSAVTCLNRNEYCVVRGFPNPDGTTALFSGTDLLTKEQAVTFIIRYHTDVLKDWTIVNPSTQSFKDVPPTNPLYREIETAKYYGFLTGNVCNAYYDPGSPYYSDTERCFAPTVTWPFGFSGITRAEYNNFAAETQPQGITRSSFVSKLYNYGISRSQLSYCTTSSVPTPTFTPVPTTQSLTTCPARCSTQQGCMMLNHSFTISNTDCKAAIPNPPLTDSDYHYDVTCGLQHKQLDQACDTYCPNLSKIDGKDNIQLPISIATTGTYTLMTQMMSLGSSANAVYVQIDKNCPVVIGDSASMPTNQWTWVDYLNGDPNSKFTASLTAGTHVIKFVAKEPGVRIARLLVVEHPCTPDTSGTCITGGASLTEATATPTPASTATPGAYSLSGLVWNDTNGDKTYNSGEPVMAGQTIYMEKLNQAGNAWMAYESATSNAQGVYTFPTVYSQFHLWHYPPTGYTFSSPNNGYPNSSAQGFSGTVGVGCTVSPLVASVSCVNGNLSGVNLGIKQTSAPTATPTPLVLPAPSGLNASCNTNGQLVFTWASNPTYTYAIRIDDLMDGWDGSCSGNDYCNNSISAGSFTKQGIPGHMYKWWLHTMNGGVFGPYTVGNTVACPQATPTITPPNLTFAVAPTSYWGLFTGAYSQSITVRSGSLIKLLWSVTNANVCMASYAPTTSAFSWTGAQTASSTSITKTLSVTSSRVLTLTCYNSSTPQVNAQKSVTVMVK